jgi:hypothetical protein
MNRRATAPLLAMLVLAAGTATATAAEFELVPLAGYRAGGSFRDTALAENRDVREHASFGLALNFGRTPDTQWEVSFMRQDTTIERLAGAPAAEPLDLRIDTLQFGGTYFWSEAGRSGVAPYVVGGLGITRFRPLRAGLRDRIEPSLNLGLGLRLPVSKRLSVRVEARSYLTLLESDGAVFCRSDAVAAACTIHARARALWQFEGLLGIALRL